MLQRSGAGRVRSPERRRARLSRLARLLRPPDTARRQAQRRHAGRLGRAAAGDAQGMARDDPPLCGGRARSRHPRDHRARDQRAAGARRERAARARALRHRDRAGDPRDAHRDVAADAARRDAAPAVRPDDARAPLVARALAPEKLLGRDCAAERGPRDPRRRRLPDRERPAARGPRPRGARPAARARRLDQQQLRGDRVPRFSHLPGTVVAAHRLPKRLCALAPAQHQLRGWRARQPGAHRHPRHPPPRGTDRGRRAHPRRAARVAAPRRARGRATAGLGGAGCARAAAPHRLGLQLLIGVAMVLKAFPLSLATAHTAGAALLLLATLALLRSLSTR